VTLGLGLSLLAVLFSGVNTAVILRFVFRAGEWFGQVNTRLDAGEKSHGEMVERLGRLESLYLQRGGLS
jgi:hypothetical protein